MDLWEAVVVAFRRWYVLVPTLIVGLLVAMAVASSVSPVHTANATVQYLPPPVAVLDQEAAYQIAANPYSDLRSLALATELAAGSEDLAADLASEGLDADYTLEIDRREPVLTIVTASTSAKSTLDTLDALVDFVVADAAFRQEQRFVGGDPELFVVADVPQRDTTTALDQTSRTRARVLLLVVAVVFAMGAAVAVESVIGALARQRGDEGPPRDEPSVVWFGVPLQGSQQPSPYAGPPSPPHLSTAPEGPGQLTGTTGDDGEARTVTRGSRWSR